MKDETKGVLAGGIGAATGAGSAIGAVAGAGIPGLGVTGITSGLAGVGSAIAGGGMIAGLATVAAAPLAVGALGYGLYKLFDD